VGRNSELRSVTDKTVGATFCIPTDRNVGASFLTQLTDRNVGGTFRTA